MDYVGQVKMLARALTKSGSGRSTGAPLACFFVMWALQAQHVGWWSVEELMEATGYDREGIAKARAALQALGVACAGSGGYGLRLTEATIRQLGLPGGIPLIGSSDQAASSSSSDLLSEGERLRPLLPESVRSVDPIRHPDLERLAGILMTYGCPPGDARGAIQAALSDGDAPDSVELQALLWIAYMRSPLGESIRYPSFVARRLEQNVPPPSFAYRVKKDDPDWRRWHREHESILERIRALGGPRFSMGMDVGEEWVEFLNRDRVEGEESEGDDGE